MITITINAVDRTADIEQGSVSLRQTLSKSPATFSFKIKGLKSQPALGQTIVVTEDATDVFKGTITERRHYAIGPVMTGYEYLCMDGYYTLDQKLVSKAYSNQTAGDIIDDIVTNYGSGISFTPPASSPTIKTARFNYEQPSRCIQKIANQIGWDWYIDASNTLQFFEPTTISAPFVADDTNGHVVSNSLTFNANITELKNVMYVRGGEYLDPIAEGDAVDKYAADGDQIAFPLVYRYNSVEVTVEGVAQTVGVDFLNDPAGFDCLYNFSEKLVKFREDNKPAVGEIVRVFGNAYVPLIVQAIDVDSVGAYGEREGVHIDKTITSVDEAELLANALLEKWREGSQEGSFVTRTTGLRVGQAITIDSDRFGVTKQYRVNSITGTMKQYGEFEYEVEFITSGQTTLTDILIDLIGKENKNIQISPDEVIQRFRNLLDTFEMSDEITEVDQDSPPYAWSPVTTGNSGAWNFATWS